MENQQEKEMTAEELAAQKEQMLQFYTESLPYLEAQLKYEETLLKIDEARFKRTNIQMQYAMMAQAQQEAERGSRDSAAQHRQAGQPAPRLSENGGRRGRGAETLNLNETIRSYYDQSSEENRLFQGTSQIEAARTQLLFQRFAPNPPAVVYDVGGAAGAFPAARPAGRWRCRSRSPAFPRGCRTRSGPPGHGESTPPPGAATAPPAAGIGLGRRYLQLCPCYRSPQGASGGFPNAFSWPEP